MVTSAQSLGAIADSLCTTARWCYARGWAPATSGNFSVRAGSRILITPTGLDKGAVMPADLLEIDAEGRIVSGSGRPSAETVLHMVIYRDRPQAGCVLHVHTVTNTLLSGHYAPQGHIGIEGYEILKGLAGVTTHAHVERIPILDNSQDYNELSRNLADALDEYPLTHGVLLSRHGLYTWGQSVNEARRHLEALEFLFQVEARRLLTRESIVPDLFA
jgi:methylthioribulose-1-phosphate dehydratase